MIDFPTSKRCPSCEKTKGAGRFYVRQNRPCALSGHCRRCTDDKAKARATANPERRREISLAYARSERGKAQRAALAATPEAIAKRQEWAERNRGTSRTIKNRWQQEHPAENRRRQSRRRARQRGAFVEDVDPRVVLSRGGGICAICEEPLTLRAMDVDHIVPLVMGGEHSYANTQPACSSCNRRKGGRAVI